MKATKNSQPPVVHVCGPEVALKPDEYLQTGTGRGRQLLVVGEAPAPNGWRISGRAFYTTADRLLPSGVRLNELLAQFGLRIEEASFTELVKCFVGQQRSLLKACGERTWDIFIEQITQTDPKLILILGKATHETFLNLSGASFELGEITRIEIGSRSRYVLSIYHPSPVSPTSRIRNEAIFVQNREQLRYILES